MKRKRLFLMFFPLVFLIWNQGQAVAAPSLELYGTFQAMGVIVTIAESDDPDGEVTYRTGTAPYQPGFSLSRVAPTRFVGSLFWLTPGTAYDVRVTFTDPDGGPLDQFVISAYGATRPEISIPTPQKKYYVSPMGSGTSCTQTTPCALTEGIQQAQAGEAVILLGGVYYQGGLELPRSGQPGAPIILRGQEGETAVLDGAVPSVFSWTPVGNGLFSTTILTSGTHLVLADGQRLFPYDNLIDLQNFSRGNTPGFYVAGTTLYVHLAGNIDPNTVSMTVSRFGTAFNVEQNHIYFVDLTFRHYGQGDFPKVLYLNNASDNLIHGCTFSHNDLGVGIKRDSHRNVIQDSRFHDSIFMWPWDDIKDVGGLEDGGVAFYDPVTGRGNIIRRNTFHDDFDGFNVCPATTAAVTNETDVYENLVYNMGDDGLETDGQCSNVRIWGNTFHDVLMGISLAPVYTGPVYAIRNLIYRTGVGNNNYSGSPFKFNSGYGLSGPMYLFHNTADAALPGNNGMYIKAPGTWRMIYSRNNIWAGTAYALENYNTGQPVNFDFDNLYNGGGNIIRWNNVQYATLAAFKAATGQENHGMSHFPRFKDPTTGDYSLQAGSPLIDAGILIPGINHDYKGSAPDMGVFETQRFPALPFLPLLLLYD
jgi:hypothetical protein